MPATDLVNDKIVVADVSEGRLGGIAPADLLARVLLTSGAVVASEPDANGQITFTLDSTKVLEPNKDVTVKRVETTASSQGSQDNQADFHTGFYMENLSNYAASGRPKIDAGGNWDGPVATFRPASHRGFQLATTFNGSSLAMRALHTSGISKWIGILLGHHFKTLSEAAATSIAPRITRVFVEAYTSGIKRGGAHYQAVDAEPAHDLKFQSLDGRWWAIDETHVTPRMAGAFGSKGSVQTNDGEALQRWFDYLYAETVVGLLDAIYFSDRMLTYRGTSTIVGVGPTRSHFHHSDPHMVVTLANGEGLTGGWVVLMDGAAAANGWSDPETDALVHFIWDNPNYVGDRGTDLYAEPRRMARFENIGIHGNAPGNSVDNPLSTLLINGVWNWKLETCFIRAGAGVGLKTSNARWKNINSFVVSNCWIQADNKTDYAVFDEGGDSLFANTHIIGGQIAALHASGGTEYRDCHFWGPGISSESAVGVLIPSYCNETSFVGCYFYDFPSNLIRLLGSHPDFLPYGIQLFGCTFAGGGQGTDENGFPANSDKHRAQIYVEGSADRLCIVGGFMKARHASGDYAYGATYPVYVEGVGGRTGSLTIVGVERDTNFEASNDCRIPTSEIVDLHGRLGFGDADVTHPGFRSLGPIDMGTTQDIERIRYILGRDDRKVMGPGGAVAIGYNTAEIGDATHALNTFPNKTTGTIIYNATTKQTLRADGGSSTSDWLDMDGNVVITPS
jgi:hypothetical protein